MKTLIACLITAAMSHGLLCAQTQLETQLSSDLKDPPTQFGEVTEADQKLVIQKVAALLGQHVMFRRDGVAATYYDSPNGDHHVEMQNLRIKMILMAPLQSDAKEKGITKRVQALLTYDAARMLDHKTNTWSAWTGSGHPLFPAAMDVFWKNGHPILKGGPYFEKFMKGPPTSIRGNTPVPVQKAPTGGNAPQGGGFEKGTSGGGLPAGMKRK